MGAVGGFPQSILSLANVAALFDNFPEIFVKEMERKHLPIEEVLP